MLKSTNSATGNLNTSSKVSGGKHPSSNCIAKFHPDQTRGSYVFNSCFLNSHRRVDTGKLHGVEITISDPPEKITANMRCSPWYGFEVPPKDLLATE